MEDYCVNCKVFRNLSNLLEKINLHQLSQHYIDKGYGFDPMDGSEVAQYSYIQGYQCDYCKSIFFRELEDYD